jgi:uncharacterized membrane protein
MNPCLFNNLTTVSTIVMIVALLAVLVGSVAFYRTKNRTSFVYGRFVSMHLCLAFGIALLLGFTPASEQNIVNEGILLTLAGGALFASTWELICLKKQANLSTAKEKSVVPPG